LSFKSGITLLWDSLEGGLSSSLMHTLPHWLLKQHLLLSSQSASAWHRVTLLQSVSVGHAPSSVCSVDTIVMLLTVRPEY
jgi:hypothetical protein